MRCEKWMMLNLGAFVQKVTRHYLVEEKDLKGEGAITTEHVQNNAAVCEMLGTRGIKPEELPPSEEKKIEE